MSRFRTMNTKHWRITIAFDVSYAKTDRVRESTAYGFASSISFDATDECVWLRRPTNMERKKERRRNANWNVMRETNLNDLTFGNKNGPKYDNDNGIYYWIFMKSNRKSIRLTFVNVCERLTAIKIIEPTRHTSSFRFVRLFISIGWPRTSCRIASTDAYRGRENANDKGPMEPN